MGDQDRTILIRFFVGLAIVLAIIALLWAIFFRQPDKKENARQTSKTTAAQRQTQQSSSGTPSPATSKPNSAVAGSTTHLAETGPGETVALFVAASVVGGLGHYLFRRRAYQRITVAD